MTLYFYTVNISPLWETVNRFSLNPTRFFELVQEFIQTRNEELFNIRLANEYGNYASLIKLQVIVQLRDLIDIIDYSDNVVDFGFNRYQFMITGES
ncbi:hypothetical protein CF8_0045 [Aeromonas phage CF8]|nr:hypothetical protein CF8_0045 [Aeromonas phage CF8]